MGWCMLFIVCGAFIMILATINLNVPFIFVGFVCFFIAAVIGVILENKKNQRNNLLKKENIKPVSQPANKFQPKYVCNNKSLVFHRLNCSYLKGIDLEDIYCSDDYVTYGNDYKYSRLIELGYKPCKRCNPY